MTTHTLNWFEISVSDMDKSAAFYGAVLDKQLRREVFFGVQNAVIVGSPAEESVNGALIADPKRPPKKGGSTLVYLHVADVSAALDRVKAGGGTVVMPAMAIEPFGTIGIFEDLDGNAIGVHTPPAK